MNEKFKSKNEVYSERAVFIFLDGLFEKYFDEKDDSYKLFLLQRDGKSDLSLLKKMRKSLEPKIEKAEREKNIPEMNILLDLYSLVLDFQKILEEVFSDETIE